MLTADFLDAFKIQTEQTWSRRSISHSISGFQFQQGTRWNPGLSEADVERYESSLKVKFPYDFRSFLKVMNGTDLPTVNVYGGSGEPHRTSTGVYSFPRDFEAVQQRMEDIRENRALVADDLREQGFDLTPEAQLVPVFGHRYVVCTPNLENSVVLSVVVCDVDAIVFAGSLREYLEREFLER